MLCIVVDDGSADGTWEIAADRNAVLLRHQRNRGKGASLRTGFSYALDHGAKTILTIDGDGQHDPNEATKLLAFLGNSNADVVLGNRMQNLHEMPFHRVLSNRITSALVSFRTGMAIQDSQTGFRVFKSCILDGMDLKCRHFDMETELLIKSAVGGFKIGAVSVDTIYHSNGVSSVSFADVWRFIHIYLRSFAWRSTG